jgi:hypothetical protein
MKDNKKLLTGISLVSGLIVLAGGVFAFFTDTVELEEQHTKVGTVELSGTIEMKHTQAKRNRLFNEFGAIYGEEDDDAEGRYPFYPDGMTFNSPSGTIQRLSEEEVAPIVDSREDVLNAFENAPDNLNPGDNLYDPNWRTNHGTDHEIIVNVTNEGSKSVQTRMIFELTGTDSEGNALTTDDLRYIHIYFDEMNSISGLTSLHDNDLVPNEIFDNRYKLYEMTETDQSENKLIYGFTQYDVEYAIDRSQTNFGQFFLSELSDAVFSKLVLSGNTSHENRELEKAIKRYYIEDEETWGNWLLETEEIDAPVSGSFKFDIAMESGFVFDDYNGEYQVNEAAIEAINKLQGADIQIKVIIQGMQYRNTGDPMWDTLFDQSFVF